MDVYRAELEDSAMLNRRSFLKWTGAVATTTTLPQIPSPAAEQSNKPYVVLEGGDVRAVIVNNEAVDDTVLPGHRGGYSGVASLTHRRQDRNLFVPLYAGLNFEHIHDGTVQPREILFEPRQAPMKIERVGEHAASFTSRRHRTGSSRAGYATRCSTTAPLK